MQLRGFPDEATIRRAVEQVSAVQYDGNIEVYTLGRLNSVAFTMTLRVTSTRGPGARRAAKICKTGKGRHLIAACWHAHRDVMVALFGINPDARITTMMADYRGFTGFLAQYLDTATRNVGDMRGDPTHQYARLCDCPVYDDDELAQQVKEHTASLTRQIRQLEREITALQGADTLAILRDLRRNKVKVT